MAVVPLRTRIKRRTQVVAEHLARAEFGWAWYFAVQRPVPRWLRRVDCRVRHLKYTLYRITHR